MPQPVIVALDAGTAWAAATGRGLSGRRLRAFAAAPLRAGALEPGPVETNLRDVDEVRAALRRVAEATGSAGQPAVLVLPDGVARLVGMELPGDVAPLEFARYRLLPALPFPADEAIVDVVPDGGGLAMAAALRRRVVAEYEDAAEAAGFRVERVDLAPLAALSALGRDCPPGPVADVVLSEAAWAMALRDGSGLRALRSRRRDRDADEPARLLADLDRTAAAAGLAGATARVVGSGARALLVAWSRLGRPVRAGWEVEGLGSGADGLELAGLGAALG